jgi:hypothetical protein
MRSFPLAEYEQRVPIRIGSLSQCFAAQHAGREEVLLKQLLPAFARVPAIASAWLECAEQNSRLDHPGCSRVLEWGEALGESYLTLPMAAAAPLRELLQAATKAALWPSLEAVVAIAEGALSALAHAHAEFGMAHLDLDPHAVLLRKDGSVLLTEFGMWRALPAEAATRERFDRGRVAYLCPELTKSLAGDARSDVFSLGAILYELISKERPFHGATQLVTAMAIAEGRRRPLRELAPQAPEMLCDIVETMLAQKPEERFQSAQAVLGAFSSCCQADPAALVEWLESLERRAGPQAGFARARRPAPPSAAAQIASAAERSAAAAGSWQEEAGAASALLGAAPGATEGLPSPLPPPLLSPSALVPAGVAAGAAAGMATGAARAPDVAAPDDWLAPPPLLSPGRPPAPLEAPARSAPGAAAAHPAAPEVRDGRTAFLDTGAARAAQARLRSEVRAPESRLPPAPRAPVSIGSLVPPARLGDLVTRDAPAVAGGGSQRPLSLGAPPGGMPPLVAPPLAVAAKPLLGAPPGGSLPLVAPPLAVAAKPLLGALPAPSMPEGPLVSSLPPLEHHAAHATDKRSWQEPSRTVFQVKAFAKQPTRRRDARAPLLVIVLLSVAFGFAVVAGGALLWRLITS